MLDKAHVMAGFDARYGKERHSSAGAVQRASPRSPGDSNLHRAVGRPLPVTVDLVINRKDQQSQYVKQKKDTRD